ncbi:hypothetical protein ATANTOWER_015188 [Ataeniobius toweri]|uniref:Uncharacterized protein n=1 Tax=Ataeniobius toweri TaxID=208326 RepID=A0ABU7AY07_9TELE|nr:hypothetical protein [Ataeniobius toweri]
MFLWLLENVRVARENPTFHSESMQTPHGKTTGRESNTRLCCKAAVFEFYRFDSKLIHSFILPGKHTASFALIGTPCKFNGKLETCPSLMFLQLKWSPSVLNSVD